MSGAAIVIAIGSAVIALGGLVWQISLYRLSGARVRLDITPALMTHRGTVVTWRAKSWPKPPQDARLDDQDMWVELARLRVANLGRTVVWVADLGLDFGRESMLRRRSRTSMTLRPVAVAGAVDSNDAIRLEPGQSATMFVPIVGAVRWASEQLGRSRLRVRAATTFGGMRAQRSARRRSWRVGPDSVAYPHLVVTRNTRLYRLLLEHWPSSDISKLYDACIEVLVVHDDPSRGSLLDVLEPYIPNLMTRIQLASQLQSELAARPRSS
jgi:hypothetical protein